MKILLVNPNQYRTPPVPPLSLEYLNSALSNTDHQSSILDLCFEKEPLKKLEKTIQSFKPDIVGITIRNIDLGTYLNNIFFLDSYKIMVEFIHKMNLKVILGGAGFSIAPAEILEYCSADYGIFGPGESALPSLLDKLATGCQLSERLISGWSFAPDLSESITGRGEQLDYSNYLAEGALLGFETQKGCTECCSFCVESKTKYLSRDPESVIDELVFLGSKGYNNFHLCDTEFNQNLEFCHRLLDRMLEKNIKICWSLYLKTSPVDRELFRKLAKTGANLVTLSVPSSPGNYIEQTEIIRRFTHENSIQMAVDYLCGFPGQSLKSIRDDIEAFKRIRPDTVGLNSSLRLYPGTALTEEINKSESEQKYLHGELKENDTLLKPVFYRKVTEKELAQFAANDPIFKLEGTEHSSNYQRI